MEQAKSTGKLGLGGKIGYGIGEVGLNLLVGGISNYLFFFYTDVFGLMAGAVGILMVVTRILDAINLYNT
jgi:GPH family glycoside/pentoside/hexuronide:cation symporter